MTPLTLHAQEIPGVLSGDITRIFRVLKPRPSVMPDGTPIVPERQMPLSPGEYWVRETWAQTSVAPIVATIDNPWTIYKTFDSRTDYGGPWESPVTMPRHLSRASLRVTDVRVHRVQDVTEAEAVDAGSFPTPPHPFEHPHKAKSATENFAALFNAINGPGSWEENPWVVGAQVERIE